MNDQIRKLETALRDLMAAYAACNGEDHPSYERAEKLLAGKFVSFPAPKEQMVSREYAAEVVHGAWDAGFEAGKVASSPPQEQLAGPADQIVSQIEELFPNWRAYRDLIDCITCELHELRKDDQRDV